MTRRKKQPRKQGFEHKSPDAQPPKRPKKQRSWKKKPKTIGIDEIDLEAPIFQSVGMPIYTLLDIPDRADLPPLPSEGNYPILIHIVTENPDLYKEMITLIRHGVAGHVAAERMGINEGTFYEWARKGRRDAEEANETGVPADTYYTRFWSDIRRAISIKRSELEMDIAVTDPRRWLASGPGRIFGDNWSDGKSKAAPPEPVNDPLNLRSTAAPQQLPSPDTQPDPNVVEGSVVNSSPEEVEEGEYEVKEDTLKDALAELEQQGVIELSRSYKSQRNKQNMSEE